MDILKSLSDEELAEIEPPTAEEIRAAIERGAEARRQFHASQGTVRSTGRRYV